MALPLRKMVTMIECVRASKFFPDKTRSGYFAPDSDLQNNEPKSDDEVSDTSRGSDSEEDRDHQEDEDVATKVVGTWTPKEVLETKQYARHKPQDAYMRLLTKEETILNVEDWPQTATCVLIQSSISCFPFAKVALRHEPHFAAELVCPSPKQCEAGFPFLNFELMTDS